MQLLEAFYDISGALGLKLVLSILTLPTLLTLYVPLSWYPSYQPLESKPFTNLVSLISNWEESDSGDKWNVF